MQPKYSQKIINGLMVKRESKTNFKIVLLQFSYTAPCVIDVWEENPTV